MNLGQVLKSDRPVQLNISGRDMLVRTQPVTGTDWYVLVALDKAEATAGMGSLLWTSVIALVVISILGSVVLGLLINASLKRLLQIRDAMDDISHGTNDLTLRLPDDGHDEVAQIARSFNTLSTNSA